MTVSIDVPAGAFVQWRHFNHSDNGRATILRLLAPDPEVLVPLSFQWPGSGGEFYPRGGAWTAELGLYGVGAYAGEEALHILDIYDPGPPGNYEGQYQNTDQLAEMTLKAWRVRWEAPWHGGGDPDFNDVFTYLWVTSIAPEGHGWTVGHLGVFPAPPE